MRRLLGFGLVAAVAALAHAAPDAGRPPNDAGRPPSDGGVVESLRVAAAPELAPTFVELAQAWARAGNPPVVVIAVAPPRVVERNGGALQIDLFAGGSHPVANEAAVCNPATEQRYARGRIAVWTRAGTPPTLPELGDPRWKKIALAEPNFVSYGRAANQALEHAGLLTALMPRLVYQRDSAAALALAREGKADVALVALALVAAEKGRYTIVSPDLYTPIEEMLVVCTRDPARAALAHAFQGFVVSPRGAQILKRHALDP